MKMKEQKLEPIALDKNYKISWSFILVCIVLTHWHHTYNFYS
jgi:hypothetical protein